MQLGLLDNGLFKKERELLSEDFEVRAIVLKNHKGFAVLISFFLVLFEMISFRIKGGQIVYCFFADFHSYFALLIARITRQKVIVRLGGYELNTIPEIGYGAGLHPIRKRMISKTVENADLLLPVAKDLAEKAKLFRPSNKPVIHVPNGYDSNKIGYKQPKESCSFITVALINSEREFLLKGIDTVFEFARKNPNCEFTVVGMAQGLLEGNNAPANVIILPKLPFENIIEQYHLHRYYLLASRSEGMPNVLCEAIFSGCIPIGFDVGDVREVISDENLIIKERTAEAFQSVLNYGQTISPMMAKGLSDSVIRRYDIKRRKEVLKEIFNKI